MGRAPEKPWQVTWRCDKVHLYSPREAFLSHPWRFSSPEWTRQGSPAAGWLGELLGSFPPEIIQPWSFLQAALDIHQHRPGHSPHPQGDFPPFFLICSQSPGFGSRLASSRMHLRADRKDLPSPALSVPIIPRGSRTGWFQAQPKLPSQILCVHLEGFKHGLICDPCGCHQKMLRASCVIVPCEVLVAQGKLPGFPQHRAV